MNIYKNINQREHLSNQHKFHSIQTIQEHKDIDKVPGPIIETSAGLMCILHSFL